MMTGQIWIQPDTLMHESRIICSLRYLLTHISLASYFVGHRQTAQTQIRRQITWRKIPPTNPKIGNELVLLIEMGTIASPHLLIVKSVYPKGGTVSS